MSNQSSHRLCPVCEQDDGEQLWRKGALRLVRCRRCSMVYVDSVAEEFASGTFYQRRSFYVSPDKLQSDYATVRFERELRLFRARCRQGAVLDVGCSTGGFLHQLRTRYPGAYEVLGTDVADTALDYAESRGLPVRRGAFLDLEFGSSQFNAITFWAVLEHVIQPNHFLEKAAMLLKPGGQCFVLVPNLRSLAVRLLRSRYRYITPEHLNYFTAATLRACARRQAAFEIIDCGGTHFNPVVIWQDFWSPQPEVSDEARAHLFKRTTAWKQHPLLKPMKALYAGVEEILCATNLADNIYLVLRRIAQHH